MQKPQYAILRFAKYKGPEIGQIEAHNERKKEKYASNPDVDVSRSHLNYHLVQPILLKALYVRTDHLRYSPDTLQHHIPQHFLSDNMPRTSPTPASVFGADVAILPALKPFTSGEVELTSAVGTE